MRFLRHASPDWPTGDPILIALLNCFGRYHVDPVSKDWNDMLTVTAEKIEP